MHQFTVHLSEPMYLAANRLNFREWIKSGKPLRVVAIIALIYIFLGGAMAFVEDLAFNFANIGRIVGVALLAGLGVLIACSGIGYALIPYRTRRLLAQQKLHQLPVQYQIGADGLFCNNELMSTHTPYPMVHKWAENEDIFLVYHSDITFNVIPKAIAGLQAIEALRCGLQEAGIAGRSL